MGGQTVISAGKILKSDLFAGFFLLLLAHLRRFTTLNVCIVIFKPDVKLRLQ